MTGPPMKPAILCLHGRGTSAMIFNFQTIRLRRELESTFDFIFIDAPFDSEPGPGVLPVFADCGPYYSWTIPGTPEGRLPKESMDVIQRTMDHQLASTGRSFVGVMGFSQGTRVASGLLLQQQYDRETSSEEKDRRRRSRNDFRFGVFLMGVPPILTPQYPEFDVLERIKVPSVHVVGLDDDIVELGRILCFDHFEQDKARFMELEGVAHHLPDGQGKAQTVKMAKAIRDVWATVAGI